MSFRPYADRLEEVTRRFLGAHPWLTHPLILANGPEEGGGKEAPVGLIIVSSDTGLCGTYNDRVLSQAERFLMEHSSASVLVIGKKGNRMLSRRGIRPLREIVDWGGRYDLARVTSLANWVQELYLSGKVSAWWVAYTQFLSALRWKPTVERFLPIERPVSEEFSEKVISEPDPETVMDELLRRFVKSQFTRIILEAFTVEHSARMVAMKNATDNASEMIEHLTLVRNKIRQSAITKELIEVVGGSEALK